MKILRLSNLYALFLLCYASIAANVHADQPTQAQQIESTATKNSKFTYEETTTKTALGNQEKHMVTINVADVFSIRLNHAVGDVCSREELSLMARRNRPTLAMTIGSVRRSSRYDGCPNELLMLNSVVYSDPRFSRPTLFFNADTRTLEIKQQKNDWYAVVGGQVIALDRLNQPDVFNNEIVAYNALFGRETRTVADGLELVVEDGKLIQVWGNCGSSSIPHGGYVVHVGSQHPLVNHDWSQNLSKPCLVPWTPPINPATPHQFAVQGALMLVDNGKVLGNWDTQLKENGLPQILPDEITIDLNNDGVRKKIVTERSARTALGITNDGLLKIVGIGGIGATLDEIAGIMQDVGCVTAMLATIDGTGLWINKSLVVTHDGPERPVGTALFIYEDHPEE